MQKSKNQSIAVSEDGNNTRQTRLVTDDLHSPGSFDTCIGECASTQGKPLLYSILF